jgi:hypothetical protein
MSLVLDRQTRTTVMRSSRTVPQLQFGGQRAPFGISRCDRLVIVAGTVLVLLSSFRSIIVSASFPEIN